MTEAELEQAAELRASREGLHETLDRLLAQAETAALDSGMMRGRISDALASFEVAELEARERSGADWEATARDMARHLRKLSRVTLQSRYLTDAELSALGLL